MILQQMQGVATSVILEPTEVNPLSSSLARGFCCELSKVCARSIHNSSRAELVQASLLPRPEAFENVDVNSYPTEIVDAVASLPGVLSASFADVDIPAGDPGWTDVVSTAKPRFAP